MMPEIFFEDQDVIVVRKPAGTDSQARHTFEADMVSEIRNHISRSRAGVGPVKERLNAAVSAEPYVGAVHRLDKPTEGIMVYAKTRRAAAALSDQVRDGRMKKKYLAVVCGEPADHAGGFVDSLLKEPGENESKVVEKEEKGAKTARLRYRVLAVKQCAAACGEAPAPGAGGSQRGCPGVLSLVEIELFTGRHHQIRVQFAAHGLPLWGDGRYNPAFVRTSQTGQSAAVWPCCRSLPAVTGDSPRRPLALCAASLSFCHPVTGRRLTFTMEPEGPAFQFFADTL